MWHAEIRKCTWRGVPIVFVLVIPVGDSTVVCSCHSLCALPVAKFIRVNIASKKYIDFWIDSHHM